MHLKHYERCGFVIIGRRGLKSKQIPLVLENRERSETTIDVNVFDSRKKDDQWPATACTLVIDPRPKAEANC